MVSTYPACARFSGCDLAGGRFAVQACSDVPPFAHVILITEWAWLTLWMHRQGPRLQ